MSEDNEPDWLAELAKGGEALRRQIEPIVQAAEQFVRDSRQAKTTGGPALPFAQRIALAVDAGMRELLPARMDAIVHPATLETSVAFPAPTVITGSGGITLPKMSFSGQGTVQNPPRGLAERSVGQILALVLVALGTAGLLCVPGPDQGTVGYDLTVLGIALAIAWRICDKRK